MEKENVEEIKRDDKVEEAERIIRNHSLGSSGIGLIPLPLVDLVGVTGVQLNMLRKLAKIYGIPFMQDKVKNLVASLIGSVVPISISGSAASFIKAIPVVGQTIGVLTMPALAGATTYAVGKVFLMHFSSGGTFLDFNPDKVKSHYMDLLREKGELVADAVEVETAEKVPPVQEAPPVSENQIDEPEAD